MAGLLGFSSIALRSSWGIFKINHIEQAPCRPCLKRSMTAKAEINYINGDEARKLVMEEGYTILDVRDKSQYDRAHIQLCFHVPLFIENMDNDFGTIVKRTVHNNFSGLFFGLPFTKLNPVFIQLVKGQFPNDRKLLVVCQEGLRCRFRCRSTQVCWKCLGF